MAIQETTPLLWPISSPILDLQPPNPVKQRAKNRILDPHRPEAALLAVSVLAILAHLQPEVATLGVRQGFALCRQL